MTIDIDRAPPKSRLASAASHVLRRVADLLRPRASGPNEIMRPDKLNDHLLRDIGFRRNESHQKFESARDRLKPW